MEKATDTGTNATPTTCRDACEDENHEYHAQDHDVTGQNVCKQTDGKCDGLYKQGDDFNRHQQQLDAEGHARRIQQVAPEVLVGAHQHYDEGYNREAKRHGDIAGEVEAEGQQAQQIVDPDKEEQRQQQRHVLHVLIAQRWLGHLIADEGDNRL